MIVLIHFTLENCMACYISIKNLSSIFLVQYSNEVSSTKELKSRYFALISLKTDSPSPFASKDMYDMSNIQTLFFRINVYLRLRISRVLYKNK